MSFMGLGACLRNTYRYLCKWGCNTWNSNITPNCFAQNFSIAISSTSSILNIVSSWETSKVVFKQWSTLSKKSVPSLFCATLKLKKTKTWRSSWKVCICQDMKKTLIPELDALDFFFFFKWRSHCSTMSCLGHSSDQFRDVISSSVSRKETWTLTLLFLGL